MSNFGTLICASGDTKTEIMKFEAGIQNTARVQNCPDITSLVSNGVSHRVGHEDGHMVGHGVSHGSAMRLVMVRSWGQEVGYHGWAMRSVQLSKNILKEEKSS